MKATKMLCSHAVYAILMLLHFTAMTLAREVGDPCEMNGVTGVCATSCKVLEDGYKRKLIKRSDFVHCGYTQFEEIICCPTHLRVAGVDADDIAATPVVTTRTTTTTAVPVTQRYEETTAKPDFWLHLLTTTMTPTTTTSTTPEPLIYQGKELPTDTEYIDLNSLLNGGNGANNRSDEEDRQESNGNSNERNQSGQIQNDRIQIQDGMNQNGWNQNDRHQNGRNGNGRNGNGRNGNGRNGNGRNGNGRNGNGRHHNGRNQNRRHQNGWNQNGLNQNGPNQNGRPAALQQEPSMQRNPWLFPLQEEQHQQGLIQQEQQQLREQQQRQQQELRQQQQQMRNPGNSEALPGGPIFPVTPQQMGQGSAAQQGSIFGQPPHQQHQQERNPIAMINEQLKAGGMEIIEAKLENVERKWQQANFFSNNPQPSQGFEGPDGREPNTVSVGFPPGQGQENWQQANSNSMGQPQPFETVQPVHGQQAATFPGPNQQSVTFPVDNQQFQPSGGGFIQTPTANNLQPPTGLRDPADVFWAPNQPGGDPTDIFWKPNNPQPPNTPSQPLVNDPFAPFAFRPSDELTSNDLETDTNALRTSDGDQTFPSSTARSITTDRPAVEICKRIASKLSYELSPHILDGIPAFLGEFPHAALIQFNTEGTKCGGALIDPKFVMTAAHCVINPRKAPISVRVGMVDSGNSQQGQEIRIAKLHIHPDYNSKLKYNDIALLELEAPAFDWETVNWETIGPACLQTDPADPPAGRSLIAIGWGLTNVTLRTQSEKLLKVELKLHDNNECNRQYQTQDALSLTTLPQGIINTQICAYASGKDACAGDSGGPLNLEIDSDRKYYNIIGVVSTGFSCGTDTPGLYTRVSSYLSYIESVVWPNGV